MNMFFNKLLERIHDCHAPPQFEKCGFLNGKAAYGASASGYT
jgi:hypothetical protein